MSNRPNTMVALGRRVLAALLLATCLLDVTALAQSGRTRKPTQQPTPQSPTSGGPVGDPTVNQQKTPDRRQAPTSAPDPRRDMPPASSPDPDDDVYVPPDPPAGTPGQRERPTLGRRDGPNLPSRSGGTGSQPTEDDDGVIRVDATLVTVPVVVSDQNGQYLPFLKQADFTLTEDGIKQDISFFTTERVPFHVALVLDVSRSAYLSINDIQDAANAFIDNLRADDQVSVFTFSDAIRQLCPFTSNRRQLRDAIYQARIEGGTKVYEAVDLIVSQYLAPIDGRKAMIFLSDGEDTTSKRVNAQMALNTVTESDVLVYTVQYPTADPNGGGNQPPGQVQIPFPFPFPFPFPRRRRPFTSTGGNNILPPQNRRQTPTIDPTVRGTNESFMRDVAIVSGGEHHYFTDIGTMRGILQQIAEELRHVYVLGYYPTRPLEDGGYRRLRVRVNEPGAKVRARSGYQARSVANGNPFNQ
jgi:hypothetical protein